MNKNIRLKLENGETNIYIKEPLFQQCKSLFINIPTKDEDSIDRFNEIIE